MNVDIKWNREAISTMVRHSGLQKEVLSLYRKILRIATEKDRALLSSSTPQHLFAAARSDPNSSTSYACSEFRRQASQVSARELSHLFIL